MRILTVLLTALTLVGFGGAAVATCDDMTKGQQTADEKRVLPPGETS